MPAVTKDDLRQLVRFGISGVVLTLFVSAIYLALLAHSRFSPGSALTIATLLASVVGFFMHSTFSFRGFGSRGRPMFRFARFLAINLFGYGLNLSFVYLLVGFAGLPDWTPVVLFCSFTPTISFMLNRRWVFQ